MCRPKAGVQSPLAALMEAIQLFVNAPGPELTPSELGKHLIGLRHGIDLLELDFASSAATFAGTDEYENQGSVSPYDWIRHNCHMTGQAASRAVTAGEQFGRLLGSAAALDAGEIGFAHFSLLAGVARAATTKLVAVGPKAGTDGTDAGDAATPAESAVPADSASPGDSTTPLPALAFDELPLLDLAREHSVSRFGHDCVHARHAYDAAAVLEEHIHEAEHNRFEFIPCENGSLAVRGLFDPVAAATLKTAVLPFARRTGAGDSRSLHRRLADALVEVASHALDIGAVPGSAGTRAHLQLTASVETVMGLEGSPGGELEHAGAVPAATVQRLACDARVRRILLGPKSTVIDVGRARRLPSDPTRDALRARSAGCEWPKCDRPVAYTNAHHLVHWAQGGATDIGNLVLLCYRHHWLIHEGGWQLARDEGGRMLAIAPTPIFRTWTRAPDGVGV
jgi:uncharacterized protein DUF222/HNH endonuclease